VTTQPETMTHAEHHQFMMCSRVDHIDDEALAARWHAAGLIAPNATFQDAWTLTEAGMERLRAMRVNVGGWWE